MPRRPSSIAWLAAVAVLVGLAALVAGGLGAFGTTAEVTQDAASAPLPADGRAGPVILSKHDSPPGFTLFGLEFGEHTYLAHIGFVPPDGCEPVDGQVLQATGPCAGAPVSGEVTGGGTLAGGEPFTIVAVEMSGDCFAAIQPGDAWPSTRAGCPG